MLLINQPSLKLDEARFEEMQNDMSWSELGVQIDEYMEDLLSELSRGIVVKESRLSWIKEQNQRLQYTSQAFQGKSIKDQKIKEFFENYNEAVQLMIEESHQWRSNKITGDDSFLENYLKDHSE